LILVIDYTTRNNLGPVETL